MTNTCTKCGRESDNQNFICDCDVPFKMEIKTMEAEYIGYVVNILPDNSDGTFERGVSLFGEDSFTSMRKFLMNLSSSLRRKGGRWAWRIRTCDEYFQKQGSKNSEIH